MRRPAAALMDEQACRQPPVGECLWARGEVSRQRRRRMLSVDSDRPVPAGPGTESDRPAARGRRSDPWRTATRARGAPRRKASVSWLPTPAAEWLIAVTALAPRASAWLPASPRDPWVRVGPRPSTRSAERCRGKVQAPLGEWCARVGCYAAVVWASKVRICSGDGTPSSMLMPWTSRVCSRNQTSNGS
jgi:hypothetical protein